MRHDAHVLLRPRHARAVAALVDRPVLRARVMQRRAQLVGVDAERFAETQAFVVGGSAGPEDQVVDHLADLAGAGRAEMKDVGGKGAERGTAGVESGWVAGAE